MRLIVAQLDDTQAKVRQIEARLGASAIAATVGDPSLFRSGREFAAWLGMTPRQNSSGGKERLGRTSKRGDNYIRSLLVAGAVAVLPACARARDQGWRMGCARYAPRERAGHMTAPDQIAKTILKPLQVGAVHI